jgi:hypothetical protein
VTLLKEKYVYDKAAERTAMAEICEGIQKSDGDDQTIVNVYAII